MVSVPALVALARRVLSLTRCISTIVTNRRGGRTVVVFVVPGSRRVGPCVGILALLLRHWPAGACVHRDALRLGTTRVAEDARGLALVTATGGPAVLPIIVVVVVVIVVILLGTEPVA